MAIVRYYSIVNQPLFDLMRWHLFGAGGANKNGRYPLGGGSGDFFGF
jgi:hypothetical protein